MIYLVTEPVRPLEVQLNEEEKCDLAISWGLHQITVSVFLFSLYANKMNFLKTFITHTLMSSFLEIDFVIKINAKRSRRFDLSEAIFKSE